MTLNLRFGLADDGKNSWEHRKQVLPFLFSDALPDIIVFQEVNGFQKVFLDALLTEHRSFGFRPNPPERWQHNLIYYPGKWSCSQCGHYYLSETPTVESKLENSRWPRQFVAARFDTPDFSLVAANTHFDFKDEVQKKSAQIVLKLLEAFPPDVPQVLMGDFNAEPGSPCHRILTEQGGFKDVFQDAHVATCHGFTGEPVSGQIDWILFRGSPLSVMDRGGQSDVVPGTLPIRSLPGMGGICRPA